MLEQRCLSCHQQGGATPLALDDPEVFAALSEHVHGVIADGSMPPWLPGEASLPLRDSLALSPAERRTLLRWLDDGAPHPDDAHLVPPPRPVLDADRRLELPPHPVAGESHRCFLVELPEGALTGFDVQASEVVHHVLLGTWPEADRATFEASDAADPAPGWSCPDAFMIGADPPAQRVPVLWFPSPAPTRTWPGTGIPLHGVGVVQVHALGSGEAVSTLELTLSDDVEPERSLGLGTGEVELPDDEPEVVLTRKGFVRGWLTEPVDNGEVWILGARGHGHEQLVHLRIALDGVPILDIPRWDSHFQSRYLLRDPLRADLDAVLSLECTYDNSPERRALAAAYGDEGEMCGGWVFATARRP